MSSNRLVQISTSLLRMVEICWNFPLGLPRCPSHKSIHVCSLTTAGYCSWCCLQRRLTSLHRLKSEPPMLQNCYHIIKSRRIPWTKSTFLPAWICLSVGYLPALVVEFRCAQAQNHTLADAFLNCLPWNAILNNFDCHGFRMPTWMKSCRWTMRFPYSLVAKIPTCWCTLQDPSKSNWRSCNVLVTQQTSYEVVPPIVKIVNSTVSGK